ncbi:MAG: membrane protein insertion efficiency factor YidD [Polyangiales bacterium]
MTWLLLRLIRLYQLTLSPLLGRSCRFEPSCSRYTAACIALHGPLHGLGLGLRRLLRCHPFHAGGYDPPPLPHPQGRCVAQGTPHPESSCNTERRARGCSRC